MTFARATDVLVPAEHAALRRFALEQEFLTKDPTGRDDVLRKGLRAASTVVFDWEGFDLFVGMASKSLRQLATDLGSQLGDIGQVELTKMTESSYFHQHIDGDFADMPGKKFAFIYYLGDRASFDGGELSFEDSLVEPADNSLVMFQGSNILHEVLPVRGENALRLTINGWFFVS